MTPIAPKRGTEIFTSANCSPLNVVGTIRVPVTGGACLPNHVPRYRQVINGRHPRCGILPE